MEDFKVQLENSRIAVIGLGYVGLPLAVAFAKKYKDGKDSKSYKNIWNDLDEGYKTPKYWYDRLNPKTKELILEKLY